jgi:HrpA-like RNA helicase
MVTDGYHAAMEFPISALLPRILSSLEAHPRLVLEAPPGAGKTTPGAAGAAVGALARRPAAS